MFPLKSDLIVLSTCVKFYDVIYKIFDYISLFFFKKIIVLLLITVLKLLKRLRNDVRLTVTVLLCVSEKLKFNSAKKNTFL